MFGLLSHHICGINFADCTHTRTTSIISPKNVAYKFHKHLVMSAFIPLQQFPSEFNNAENFHAGVEPL